MLAFSFRHHAPRALTLGALVISGIAVLPASASANTIQNYGCTNGLQSSTVPANASTATITLKGAQGGQNAQEKYNAANYGSSANLGGPGDAVQISLPVTPGSSFAVNVGCIDGYNGGGLGGTDGYYGYFYGGIGGGSGGGATDITPTGGSFSQAYGVAGGGGGAGDIAAGLAPAGTGGNGGNSSNDSGGAGGASGPTAHGGLGGQGGYYGAAGGVGGSGANFTGANGASGSGSSGGSGGNGSYWGVAGGAGGGGWVGAGGGGGGGQGSTYTDSGSGGGGGGGSSYVASGVSSTFLGAGNLGDGSVTINYNTPTLAVSPSSDNYGDVTVGQSSTRNFTVSNSGGNTLTLGTVSVGGTNSGQFAITQDNCSGQSLTGAGTCTVQVAFAPNTKGSDSATLSLPSNSDSGSPTTVPLSGVAQNPPTVSVESSQGFGTVTTGQSQAKTITLTNSGDETLTVGQLSVSGQNVADFSIVSGQDNCSSQSVAPQATCTVEMAFAPTSDGAKSASLTIASNDPNSPANVALTGTGQVPASPPPGSASATTTGQVLRSGKIVDPGMRVSCPSGGASCWATETVAVLLGTPNTPFGPARRTRRAAVGRASFQIPASSSVEATFALNRLGMILVTDHKHLRLQVSLTARTQGATPLNATRTISLAGHYARYTISRVKVARDGSVTLRVHVTDPGRIYLLLTAWKNNIASVARVLKPAAHRFVVGRASATATHAGTLTLHLHPNAKGRRLIDHPAYPVTVRLSVSYIPLYAFQVDTGYYNLRPGHGCTRSCHTRTWP